MYNHLKPFNILTDVPEISGDISNMAATKVRHYLLDLRRFNAREKAGTRDGPDQWNYYGYYMPFIAMVII